MIHFKRKEFACKCKCGFDTVDIELLPLCEEVRELEGEPVEVLSGCRCKAHTNDVGGKRYSMHTNGRAADLSVSDPLRVFDYLCNKYPDRYGLGLYDWGVHVDTRTNGPARWDGRKTKQEERGMQNG
jgi:uncharacterized protein YcbK (DUF882 family)